MYGGKCEFSYVKGLTDTVAFCTANGISHNVFFMANESLIPRARNYMVDEFMRSGYTHMLFIDADIGFTHNEVLSLLALADPQSDKDIVCAPYPKKCISWEKIKTAVQKGFADNPNHLENFVGDYVFNPVSSTQEIRINELSEVCESGTGFMMIQRKALEKFSEAYPQYSYRPDHVRTKNFDGSREIMTYFHCEIDPKTKRYLSEDYWFCQKSRDAGIKVWLAPWLSLSHAGMYVFGGSLAAMARLGVSPTADITQMKKIKRK